ncbi:hypothetical protein SL103_18515 [Streptomyces lydicus]|uniref:Uncharacterized protein n=1 Tax=Streptomyces lydicus TaxID=47763 RepID=A0A1D7VMI8_9ACTN|nr:hypothetical protein SL103_18515 [Streptomyces lydicus]
MTVCPGWVASRSGSVVSMSARTSRSSTLGLARAHATGRPPGDPGQRRGLVAGVVQCLGEVGEDAALVVCLALFHEEVQRPLQEGAGFLQTFQAA